ncbi:MAG TPA: hypothetical protein VNE58_02000 [Casimicrobiaceae bacterium]|nr:hypothetical protein [Casimicrobiaceae bacterium]
MKTVRALALTACVMAAAPAQGSATLTNYTDLWWTPAEAGNGYNIAQQSDTMFVTFYVFGTNSQATWYTALLVDQGPQVDGATLFAGNVFQSSGPPLGSPYDIAAVRTTAVGTASFRSTAPETGTLAYSTGSVSVVKSIQRFFLKADTFVGTYLGGTSDITSNCTNPANNNIRTEESGTFTVVAGGNQLEIRGPRCSYIGFVSQLGQVARMDTNYSCTDGARGFATFFDLRVEPGGITGRYTGVGSSCNFAGNLGFARKK